MRTLTAMLGLGLVAMFLAPPAVAHAETQPYHTATTPGVGVTCANNCGGSGLNIGGARFLANGHVPVSVVVTDGAGGSPYIVVCQSPDNDNLCGESGEPRASGCGGATLSGSSPAFTGTHYTLVFVYIVNPSVCTDIGTSGTISMLTSP